jgi:hypothetical protein
MLPAATAWGQTYVFAVVPQFPAVEVFRTWRPLLDAIEQGTGYKFEVTLESEAGVGTCVTLWLPRRLAASESPLRQAA